LRSAWPPGKPLEPVVRIGTRTFRVELKKPLRLSGFTSTSLGRARLPFCGTCSPPCTSLISLMIEGAVAPLPPFHGVHPEGFQFWTLTANTWLITSKLCLARVDPLPQRISCCLQFVRILKAYLRSIVNLSSANKHVCAVLPPFSIVHHNLQDPPGNNPMAANPWPISSRSENGITNSQSCWEKQHPKSIKPLVRPKPWTSVQQQSDKSTKRLLSLL
jgi:hypothetical protein